MGKQCTFSSDSEVESLGVAPIRGNASHVEKVKSCLKRKEKSYQ